MEDLIDKRNKKEKIARGIIKWWKVRYMSKAEVEAQEEEKRRLAEEEQQKQGELDLANEIFARLEAEAAADEAKKQAEIELAKRGQLAEDTYNASTKSFSGTYGQQESDDEVTNEQIHQILEEKENQFEQQLQEALVEAQNGDVEGKMNDPAEEIIIMSGPAENE